MDKTEIDALAKLLTDTWENVPFDDAERVANDLASATTEINRRTVEAIPSPHCTVSFSKIMEERIYQELLWCKGALESRGYNLKKRDENRRQSAAQGQQGTY